MQKFKLFLAKIFLSKRAKALYWSVAMMTLAGMFAYAADHFASVAVPTWVTVFFGLVFSQVSKALNNYLTDQNNGGIY